MIAFPSRLHAKPRVTAMDTGCIFPFGKKGDVRLRLLTDNPVKAQACGENLRKWGLLWMPEIITQPKNQGLLALDLAAKPELDPYLGREAPKKITFGGDFLILETLEPEDIVRFAKWYDQKARAAVAYAPEKPKSLNDLANAGEIETIGL
jgi:hypothetical protein